ncbi:MAG: cellulase family glycosylhydrolase [Thiothrix sp.]|uniref:cellulase family glycosylhydrolase n=1 Tax=Thiothrix sp. TaxID=1032 RepID=UPI00261D17E5|nr:cellulase family glycosylhydrolase [Thiothrix sp.]MDD5395033.1 cellulase family glycosylhydrolase [Thiothrix sp.]
MKRKTWFYALPLVLAVQGALAGTNLIADGGFESGSLLWSGAGGSVLALNSAAAFSGQNGLQLLSANTYCANGALYTLNATAFQPGKLYEFGARTRLGSGASADLRMGLIKNGAAPVYLDGYNATSKAYPDHWTRLFGAYIANFAPTDSLKLCISGGANIPTYLDEAFVRPLTTAEVGYQPPATLDYENLVQADGNRLVVGAAKTPFNGRGINVEAYNYGNDIPGTENAIDNFGWKNYDESSFQEIAGLGFNTVRLMMSFVVFEDNANPGVYKDEGWAWLDRNIQWAKKHNLRLLLDMHEPPGGGQLPNQLGLTTATKARLENLWAAIAQRYRNETTVLGYDLLNEPYTSDWFAYAPTLISKIRAVDPNHLIYIQPSYNPTDQGVAGKTYPLPFNNMVYDVHFYDTFASSDTGTTPYAGSVAAFKSELANEFDAFYDASTDSFPYPLNSGEYGVVHAKYAGEKNLGAEQWMVDLSAAMDYYGINRHMFAYHETRFGLYSGWQTYPGESTTVNVPMKAMVQALNNVPVTPGTDSLPDAPNFAPQTAVLRSTAVESAPVTISGVDKQIPINVYSGTYSINGGAYVSTAGTVKSGDVVKVKHTSSASYATKVSTKVIIGGAVGYFTSTTQDITPNTFSFATKTGVLTAKPVDSAPITVTGIDAATDISISAGSLYSINGTAFTSTAGTKTVKKGDTVVVRHTSSASYSASVTTTLTIGGVKGTFKSTTAAKDTTPVAFSFTALAGVAPSTVVESNTITVSGINAAAAISVTGTGAAYSINGGAYTSAAGTVNVNNTVKVRHTSSSKAGTAVTATLNIGGVKGAFKSTTR